MSPSKPLILLLLGSTFSLGSSLSVYQDKAFYTFMPENNFIGFVQDVSVKCKGTTIPLADMSLCPPEQRLCKLVTNLQNLEETHRATGANIKTLEQLMGLPKPTTLDAKALIDTARVTAQEKAKLFTKEKKLTIQINQERNSLRKQVPRLVGSKIKSSCEDEIEVSIPFGIHFTTMYEANIVEDKEIEVTQYLSVRNSSGVDIYANTAYFYYKSANQYVNPVHFNPWVVSKYVARTTRHIDMVRKTMRKEAVSMAMTEADDMGGAMIPQAVKASYEDAREYKIEKLPLPSSGVPVDVQILSWKSALRCEVRAYPYANTSAFQVCTFTPKYQIDSNAWKIKSSGVMLNERATGEYRENNYTLYTKVEKDIQIQRKQMVKKERETGIFGGTARKKDGFTITITNKSDKEKSLTLIERIPTSTTDEIKAKLLNINSDKKVNYKMLKDGKIKMDITLVANETKKIEVLFEISYDKDLKVSY